MSKIEISFDVNKIEEIKVTPLRESSYKWFPEIKEEKDWFGRVKIKYVPAGWSDYVDGRVRHSTEELENYYYLADELEKKVWFKAYVEVLLANKGSIVRRFNSNDEATGWAESLRKKSKKTFEVFYI